MKRIYSIAVATAILSAVGLSGAWFLSGPSAGANNSPGSSGINIEADSPASSPGTTVSESGNSSPQQQEKVSDTGVPAAQSAKAPTAKHDADKYSRIPDGESVKGSFRKGQADSLAVAGGAISFSGGTLLRDTELSVSVLGEDDMPELDFAMTNVTAQGEGYRFLPHGTHFSEEGATVRLGYDRTRIPSGYTEDDIRTFYYDTEQEHWVALDRIAVNKEFAYVESRTTHFTDMINGVIQAPESPETEGFAPTMMNDIKAADPTAKLNIITPPTANNRGSANLQYAFEMPPARNGMAPSLAISYNSDGGNGWLGQGWDLSVPSITLDTRWGVPRYDLTNETETYSLSGAMLSTMDDNGAMSVAHRGDRIARKSDRQFYTRQGGDFSRIIRKGSCPADYYWEVTDKQGVVYTYGGEGAVLKGTITDLSGNTREVISEWKLKRVVETHGDWIEYEYTAVDEPVRGGLVAKAIYLSKVSAGNAESDGPHTVVTLTGNKTKRQKANNARYGYLTSSNRLLENVQIDFMGEKLRSYSFSYVDGAFHKDMLESVRQFDDMGNEFAFQKFDYYDDVQSGNGYVPFKSESETWNTHNDGLDAGFINPLQSFGAFTDNVSALGGTKSNTQNVSFYTGVGIYNGDPTKSGTLGGSFNYSHSSMSGVSALVDINGDGLADKVYEKNGKLRYRPQIKFGDNITFGEELEIKGINKFSNTSTNTVGGGIKLNVGFGDFTVGTGNDMSSSTSKTDTYFSDVNGDGLIDIVHKGKVYFNHIEYDSENRPIPTFTASSSDTPSPILSGGVIDSSMTEISEEEQEALLQNSPMLDIVRVWIAPYPGNVNISGTVQLILPESTEDSENADGVRLAIQHNDSEIWHGVISANIATPIDANISSRNVTKGDKIYFRLQSGNDRLSNGAYDNVKWNPVIEYVGKNSMTTPNGHVNNIYDSKEGNVLSAVSSIPIESGDISINGVFTKPRTSDDVVLRIFAANEAFNPDGSENVNYRRHLVYERNFLWSEEYNGELPISLINNSGDTQLEFEVFSTSNVAWDMVHWKPSVSNTVSKNGINSPVKYSVYAAQLKEGEVYKNIVEDSVKITPEIQLPIGTSGELILTLKSENRLIHRMPVKIQNGLVTTVPDTVKLGANENVWTEFFTDNRELATQISDISISLLRSGSLMEEHISSNLFTESDIYGFGSLYRGWGQFVYNAADNRFSRPIEQGLLTLPNNDKTEMDPRSYPFSPLVPSMEIPDRWIGPNPDVYISCTEMGASRLADKDVKIVNPLDNMGQVEITSNGHLEGSTANGITLITKGSSTAVMAQGGISAASIGGSLSLSTADGSSRVVTSFMDMNGDGYPDIITDGSIQYTNTRGGFDGEIRSGFGSNWSENSAKTISLGGSVTHSFTVGNTNGAGSNPGSTAGNAGGNGGTEVPSSTGEANVVSSNTQNKLQSADVAANLGFDLPLNKDKAAEAFIDINGDGLPDKIYSDKKVSLNLGYGFTAPIEWDINKIQESNSVTVAPNAGAIANLGFDKAASSFAAGYSLGTTSSDSKYELLDVNGDGLVDKLWKDGSSIYVALNTGNGFDTASIWNGLSDINKSASTSESANAAFTIAFPVPIPPVTVLKIAINPGTNIGHGMSRTNYELRDIDGDGYLDIVESDSESELKVTRSAIGRTNMLKSVTNSIGGRFEVDYAHSTPTYGHPGGKWVMSALTIDDGIHDDGPLMKSAFEYSDGFHDRHERDFLGFGKVVTKSLDTNSGNSVYRQAVQEFAVDNYYASGNLVASYVTDASGNKFTETVNEYDAYSVTANKDSYSFVQKDVIYSDRASAFVPLRYTANKQYEGTSDGMVVSEAWNEYYLNGYHGELKSYRYSDKGNIGSNGAGGYDYATNIQYTSNDSKHIFGLPTNVTVVGGDGSMYHNVSATYDTKYPNHLTQVSQQLGSGVAVTDYKYDRYGNITQKTLPANGTGQRMWYKYRYEPEMNMYVERIEDAWGYRSEAGNFDYRYGVALERRDLNNFYYETEIDNMGRVTKVRGPNELATGVDYIIAFEYKPKAEFGESGISAPAYAVTKHYDIQHPGDDLETVTFVDGFGRPVQVKKDGVVTTASKGSGASDQNVMIVSGRNVYDAFGRVAKAYYPTTEGMGGKTSFSTTFDNVNPTITAYDVLDRALEVTLPDGAKTETKYLLDMGSNALVTRVKDALGNEQSTYANGSGKAVKSIQHSGPDGDIETSFEYDGIQRLVKVTDVEGNVTTSVYDMGDRRTEVNHPASGITSFTYDPLGNVLTKQTANMAEEGKMITYSYDYHRLTGINYPDHPENNVKYYYGGRNASYNRIGRLMMREDGTGAIEYFYGKMGEVTKTRRTLIVPNQAIATYVTQWTYDSHNRLIEMIYPDEEKVTYSYNLGGLLEKVRGEKSYGYDYITKLGYDKFEQRSYMKYCNGAETFYTYDDRRRLSNLAVNSGGTSIMDNAYTFDAVSNVLSVVNNASLPANGNAGGQMSHTYTYDGLYRLAAATGTYTGADNKSASYTLAMGYDNMHRIKSKSQHLTQDNVQFNGTLNVGYDLTYTYGSEEGKKFQLESVKDVNYRTEETPSDNNVENGHVYTYDKNGNLVYVNTNRVMTDGHRDNSVGERKLIWDEENRLLAVDDNGFVSNYWYDADGERTVKTSGESDQVYVNGVFSGGSTNTAKFSLYVSPYLVANQGGRYTKHIYAGSQRIVSKVGDFASYGSDPRRIEYAGANTDGLSVDYKSKYAAQQQVIKDNYKFFDVPYNGTDNDNYADGEGFCCNDGSMEAAVALARKAQVRAVSRSFKDPDNYENLQFFYHPDHLGSSSFITNLEGEVVQHIEYIPFGEVFIEERNNVWNTPYLFNAKEFDEETGMYYYGARYYEPRLSLWISTDKLQEEYPDFSSYTYTHNNPIKFVDPDGNIPLETIWDAANVSLGVSSLISNVKQGKIGAAVVDGLGVIVDAAATVVPYVPGGVSTGIKTYRAGKTVVKATKAEVKVYKTSRAARREVMRKQKIPTSMQPKSQSKNASGREYTYEVPKNGGGKQLKSVQQQTKDRSHEGQPHWEAGEVKVRDGKVQYNNYNRPKSENSKSKVNYNGK